MKLANDWVQLFQYARALNISEHYANLKKAPLLWAYLKYFSCETIDSKQYVINLIFSLFLHALISEKINEHSTFS